MVTKQAEVKTASLVLKELCNGLKNESENVRVLSAIGEGNDLPFLFSPTATHLSTPSIIRTPCVHFYFQFISYCVGLKSLAQMALGNADLMTFLLPKLISCHSVKV